MASATVGNPLMNKPSSSLYKRSLPSPGRLLNFVVAAGGHWIFQSMLYMDRSERRFKLALDAALTLLCAGAFVGLWAWPWPLAIGVGFVLAHTFNFIFNAQICALGANYGLVHLKAGELQDYAQSLGRRAEQNPAIAYAAVCGSLAHKSGRSDSDLDVRLLRRPGLLNGVRAGWFVLLERSRALFTWFPLDIYLFDSETSLRAKLKAHETLTHLPSDE